MIGGSPHFAQPGIRITSDADIITCKVGCESVTFPTTIAMAIGGIDMVSVGDGRTGQLSRPFGSVRR